MSRALIVSVSLTAAGVSGLHAQMGHVESVGSGPRDVILMPCLGCDWRSWDQFMERNRNRYRMFAVTWPGLGDTALPEVSTADSETPYFDYLVEELLQLIEREQLRRPVMVGHSAAAVLAVRFAAEHPQHVGAIVNVDAIVANGDTYGYTRGQRLAWADAEMADVLAQYDNDSAWTELNADPNIPDPERSRFYGQMWRTPDRRNVFAYWRDWLRTDAGVLLPDLPMPFLAVHALSRDPERAAAKRQDLQWRYGLAPMPVGGRIVYIEESGHTIWEWQPESFDRVIVDFIDATAVSTFDPNAADKDG